MDQKKTVEGSAALWMQYSVISKMTGVYSNYFENEASAIVILEGADLLKTIKERKHFEENTEMPFGN